MLPDADHTSLGRTPFTIGGERSTVLPRNDMLVQPTRTLLCAHSTRPTSGAAWLRMGFRPFFLGGALHAVLAVPVWVAQLIGLVSVPSPLSWHAHEQIFGFLGAVIAGFLLTAIGNWTGRTTISGPPLLGLFACWAVARVSGLHPSPVATLLALAADGTFWAGLSLACTRPLIDARSSRNYVFIPILAAMGISCGLSYAERLGLDFGAGARLRIAALDLVVLFVTIFGGRVIPSFTRGALVDADVVSDPTMDRASAGSVLALAVAQAFSEWGPTHGVLACCSGLALLLRARRWGAIRTHRSPLLWVLHLGHGLMSIGLLLRGVATWTQLPPGAALHAITVAGISMVVLGMMARVSLGHTGRLIVASRRIAWAFALLLCCGVVRVLGVLVWNDELTTVYSVAGVLWCAAFIVFLVEHGPALLQSRVDGRFG